MVEVVWVSQRLQFILIEVKLREIELISRNTGFFELFASPRQLIFEAPSQMFPDGAVQLPVQSTGERYIWSESESVFIDVVVETGKGLRLLDWHRNIVWGL